MQKELYRLMLKYGFKPNHKLDQNFIIDANAVSSVVSLLKISKDDVILEIGGGTGFLTKELVNHAKKVIVIEKDNDLAEVLSTEISAKNLEIINDDFLKVDISKIKFTKITGFIPYSISSGIIEKISSSSPAVLVVQKEFAEKLTALPGFENYNAISVLAQTYGIIKIHKTIKRGSFFPVPKCESSIITIDPKKVHKSQDEKYNLFVKGLFRHSNKDLGNSMKMAGVTTSAIKKINQEFIKRKVKLLDVDEIEEIYKTL